MFTSSNNQNYFITLPFINDESFITFELLNQPHDLFFSLKSSGASVLEKLDEYCNEKSCTIPMVIGGQVTFEILHKKRIIYSDILRLPHLSMNCTIEPWTNRICTFHNICYNKDETFSFESPYEIQFDPELLCLGSKTPPVDLELNRLTSKQIKTVKKFNSIIRQKVTEPSHLVSIYYNMHMLWHSYYDYLFPLYETLKLYSNEIELKNRRIFLPNFVPFIPELTGSLSIYKIEKLASPLCFSQLTMGMVKITDRSLSETDPPYSFCTNCSCGLRDAVLNYFNVTAVDKENSPSRKKLSLNLVVVRRKSLIRKILNVDELFESLKKKSTFSELLLNRKIEGIDVNVYSFELMPLKRQVEVVSRADLLIAVHGSGLANILWMRPGSAVVEIMPGGFTCRDWYSKAAKAAGVNYYAYYAKSDGETVDGNIGEVKKCLSNKKKCQSKKCIDVLRDRNINLNVEKFSEELNAFLNSIQILN